MADPPPPSYESATSGAYALISNQPQDKKSQKSLPYPEYSQVPCGLSGGPESQAPTAPPAYDSSQNPNYPGYGSAASPPPQPPPGFPPANPEYTPPDGPYPVPGNPSFPTCVDSLIPEPRINVMDGSFICDDRLKPPNFQDPPKLSDDSEDTGCCVCRGCISFLGHVGFFIGVIGMLITRFVEGSDSFIVFAILTGVSYGFLWLETWCSHDMSYLTSMTSLQDFKQFMQDMHSRKPTITFSIECYHNETRYRTVYYRDSQGNSHSRVESYTEKVVTHRESEPFVYTRCKELSPTSVNISGNKATRIAFYDTWVFADLATRDAYTSQFEALKSRNIHRDSHMDSSENYTLPSYQKRMLTYVTEDNIHPCYNVCCYVLLSFIVFTWPYRWWFKASTGSTNYTFVKQIGI